MSIVTDATKVLLFLADYEQIPGDSKKGRYTFSGPELSTKTQLDPDRLNDAVEILSQNGYVEVLRHLGTAPFGFAYVELTSLGRVEADRVTEESARVASALASAPSSAGGTPLISRSPQPIGSPFGFKDEDWEVVMRAREDRTRLLVVFGHQWESRYFMTSTLRDHVGRMFEAALSALKATHHALTVSLDYRPLKGGYGEHLFNDIARDIISADIAVFDASDLNPNVMIEMGVALTWGLRVLPIRDQSAPKPPSDVSGQTWAAYSESGSVWEDPDHASKLVAMVERALRKKGVPF
jgi:DNA-binding MarR family transcriptional regulator